MESTSVKTVSAKVYKLCANCAYVWTSREAFLNDPSTTFVGYQASFSPELDGFFLFNHKCKSTITIPESDFNDLAGAPPFNENKHGCAGCSKLCDDPNDKNPCPMECTNARGRKIMQALLALENERALDSENPLLAK